MKRKRFTEEQIIGVPLRHRCAWRLYHLRQVPIGAQHAEQIGERIIPELEPAYVEEIGPQAQILPIYRFNGARCGE